MRSCCATAHTWTMANSRFHDVVATREALREIVGHPSELVVRKQLTRLDPHARRFIDLSPFLVIGTSGAGQSGDVSPRGDAPGFVAVLDDNTLVIPERPGNRRSDTLVNILETGGVALIFMVPGREETLRVNGQACIVRDADLLDRTTSRGNRPSLVIVVDVRECFFHCAKAFKRSALWQPASWPDAKGMASLAQILMDQVHPANTSLVELEQQVAESYAKRLY